MQSLRIYFRNMLRTPFAFAFGMFALIGGIRYALDPESLPVEAVLKQFGYVWAIVFSLGGLFMLYGMATLKTRFEAAGTALFTGGVVVQGIVTAAVIGASSPFLTFWSVVSLLIFGISGVVRTLHLMRGQVLMWIADVDTAQKFGGKGDTD